MDFYVIYRANAESPWEVAGVIENKKRDEGETAIEEAMTRGPGTYKALPSSGAVTREATTEVVLTDPAESPETEES